MEGHPPMHYDNQFAGSRVLRKRRADERRICAYGPLMAERNAVQERFYDDTTPLTPADAMPFFRDFEKRAKVEAERQAIAEKENPRKLMDLIEKYREQEEVGRIFEL